MKKYFLLNVFLLAVGSLTSFAQLNVSKTSADEFNGQVQMVQIKSVSSNFVPVHINLLKPFAVSLDRKILENLQLTACDRFKNITPTLKLQAERVSEANAKLQWQTKYAFYATGFQIERSIGDLLHFATVRFENVTKTTAFKINYQLPDYNEFKERTFYRIKQLNNKGSFVYSNIVCIKGSLPASFKIYPIPASNTIFIEMGNKQNGTAVIVMYDLAGRFILQQSFAVNKSSRNLQSIDISRFSAGSYTVKILMPDKSFLLGKFIKK